MAKEYIPLDIVRRLAEEGKSEAEIVGELKLHGFTDSQIDKSLKSAIKEKIEFAEEEPEEEAEEIEREPGTQKRPVVTGEAKEIGIKRRPSEEEIPERLSEAEENEEEPEEESMIEEEPEEIVPPEESEMPKDEEPEEIEAPSELEEPLTQMGLPSEAISIPEKLKPIEIGNGPATEKASEPASSDISLEEIVEAVVQEKTSFFEEKINDFERRMSESQKQIDGLASVIESVSSIEKKTDTELNKGIRSLSDSFDEIKSRVSALEKAFKELSMHAASSRNKIPAHDTSHNTIWARQKRD